jgi:hypothetical protein
LTIVSYDAAVPNDERSNLREDDPMERLEQLAGELETARADYEALKRAHDAQSRHLIAERLVLAEQIEQEVGQLREEIEWRKDVMEKQEAAIEHHKKVVEVLLNSRSIRYTEPLRRIASVLRK